MMMRRGALVFVAVFGLAVATVALTAAQSGNTIPGGTYTGIGVDTSGACQEGALRVGEEFGLRLSDHGTMIVDLIVSDLVTPLGSFDSFTIPVRIPIDESGRFDQEFDPLNIGLALVRMEGQFEGDTVSGSLSVRAGGVVECEATFTAQGEPPLERAPVTYPAPIETVDMDCGGGDIDLTVSGDRLSVIAISVRDLDVHGTPVSASATFGEGTVPIDEDGSFGWAYFAGEEVGQEIAVIGTVSFGFISGGLTISPSECGAIPFGGVNVANSGRGGDGLVTTSLPQAGAVPTSSGNSLAWLAVLAAVGAALLGLGAVSLAKR